MTDEELAFIREHFTRCEPWIKAALDRYPIHTHDLCHVLEALEQGRAQIWPTPNSVCITTIETYPTGVKAIGGWLAGGELAEIKTTVSVIEDYAISVGCSIATLGGRPGWIKAFPGYKEAGRTFYKELT
jgi:hypothetical protein